MSYTQNIAHKDRQGTVLEHVIEHPVLTVYLLEINDFTRAVS